jgi:hypothetical protein
MTNVEHLEITMPNYKSFMRPELLLEFPRILEDNRFLQHLHSIRVRAADHDFYDLEYRPEFEPYHGYPASFFLPLLALPSLRSAEIKDAFDMLDSIVEYTDLVQDHHLMVIRSYQMVSYPNPSSRSVITIHCVPLRVTSQAMLDLATSRAPDEFLPRQLEVLHFRCCDELVIPHLKILISNLSNTMSKLENIRIDRWNLKIAWRYQQDDITWRSATAEQKQRIIGLKQTRDVYEAAGVGFLVDHIHASNLVKTEGWEDVLALL